jgi:DNA-binding response OmpR family regulator
MPKRVISLLHVEDDALQRSLVRHHLAGIDEYEFDIQFAETEETAFGIFDRGGVEFVILDYQLRQGNGLHCLKELRKRDPIVPVIAVSGVATREIAAELLQAGADDFLSKADLTSSLLARIVREAVLRTDACRRRITRNRRRVAARSRMTRKMDSPDGG